MAVFMKNVVLITKRWETTNQSYNFCMFAQHNSISFRQSGKENKSTTTHRRWSLTRVFYAMYLERTIIDFTGGHGVYTLPRQKRLNASTACSMRCLFFIYIVIRWGWALQRFCSSSNRDLFKITLTKEVICPTPDHHGKWRLWNRWKTKVRIYSMQRLNLILSASEPLGGNVRLYSIDIIVCLWDSDGRLISRHCLAKGKGFGMEEPDRLVCSFCKQHPTTRRVIYVKEIHCYLNRL